MNDTVTILLKEDIYFPKTGILYKAKQCLDNVSKFQVDDMVRYKTQDGNIINDKTKVIELGFITAEIFRNLGQKGIEIDELKEKSQSIEDRLSKVEKELKEIIDGGGTIDEKRLRALEEKVLLLSNEQLEIKLDIDELTKFGEY